MVKLVPEHLQPTTDRGTPISSKRRNELIASYAPDWLIAGALWVAFALIDNVDGFHREFSLSESWHLCCDRQADDEQRTRPCSTRMRFMNAYLSGCSLCSSA